MPNHVTTIIEQTARRDFDMRQLANSQGEVDFEEYCPMPAEIDMNDNKIMDGRMPEWYEWRVREWGTKWNAYDQDCTEDQIRFDTAWAHPFPIIALMSRAFPETSFSIQYADEDIGSNCGWYIIENGEIAMGEEARHWSDMDEDEQRYWQRFACELLGQDYALYLDDYALYFDEIEEEA